MEPKRAAEGAGWRYSRVLFDMSRFNAAATRPEQDKLVSLWFMDNTRVESELCRPACVQREVTGGFEGEKAILFDGQLGVKPDS